MSWLLTVLFFWFLFRLIKTAYQTFFRASPAHVQYVLSAEKNCALALAHPAAVQSILGGFADEELPTLTPELAQSLRPALKHFFRLKANLTDVQIAAELNAELFARWYRLDLDALGNEDVARDAVAFACARTAYAVRVAALLGWLTPATQWQLLELNRVRAAECFSSWDDFGQACARGRLQWIRHSRADSLGSAFTPADVAAWTLEKKHPWCFLPWQQAV